MIEDSQDVHFASIFKLVPKHQENMAFSMIREQKVLFSEELKSENFEKSQIKLISL